jgi:energy-coupling factor transporter ATP-binding protein EcfA2
MTSENPYDTFLSYNSRDRALAKRLAERLRAEGLTPFVDFWELLGGRPWPPALEKALENSRACTVLIGPHGLGRWQIREMYAALDRQVRDPDFPVIPLLIPGGNEVPSTFLRLNTWVDMRRGVDDGVAFNCLLASIRSEPPGPEVTASFAAVVRPYVGLRAFREEDTDFFCGREAFTERLVEAIGRTSFLTVVGPSGSGKSSVVLAGLIPALRQGALPGSKNWEIAVFAPGDRPLRRLAARLVALLEPGMSEVDRLGEMAKLADYLQEGQVTLAEVAHRVLEKQPGTERLVLLADQFEELFALCQNEVERAAFTEQLLDATADGRPVMVVLTLRADFYGHLLGHRPLGERVELGQVNILPMSVDELRLAIEVPVEKVGLCFEDGLVERVLEDVADEPGALPLLEFALTELWERRRSGMLPHAAYEDIGKVGGAIAQRAEHVYAHFSEAEKQLAQRVFLRLVAPGVETKDTRRQATLGELQPDDPTEAKVARGVVKALADARLVTTGRDETTGQETVEVAHEALIRGWERLRGWVEEDRAFLTWRQRLGGALREWERLKRDAGMLLRGGRLAEAERWLGERGDDLSPYERAFIEASLKWVQQEIWEVAERRRAEEELLQSYVRLQRGLEGTVNIVAVAIEMRDPYTAGHQRRVTQLACAIAKEMGLPEEQIEGLRMAGRIHDLGKINVPAEVLSKPGRLTDLEYGLIKVHPQVGHDMLKTIEFPWPVAPIVLQHHERMDGSGYPQGLSGEEIILEARILGVADVVEAMASHRPYRPARGIDKALEEISQNRGVLYDPKVVDACLKLFAEKGFEFE